MLIKNQGARPFDRSCEDNIFKRSSGITSFNMTPFQYLVGHDEKMWDRNGYHLECEPCFYRLLTSPFLANQKIRLIHNQAGVHCFWWLCPSGINGDSYARNDQMTDIFTAWTLENHFLTHQQWTKESQP